MARGLQPMSKYLIQEISEARVFYNNSTLKGRSAKELAQLAFTMTMALQILRYTKERAAISYAASTYKYQDFETIYSNTTDLYNLLVVLGNQAEFGEYIEVDTSIHFPKLQYKRYLRDIAGNHTDLSADRTFFFRLEQYFNISDSYLKIVRRTVCDWQVASHADREHAKSLLDNKFRQLAQYIDLNLIFNSVHIE